MRSCVWMVSAVIAALPGSAYGQAQEHYKVKKLWSERYELTWEDADKKEVQLKPVTSPSTQRYRARGRTYDARVYSKWTFNGEKGSGNVDGTGILEVDVRPLVGSQERGNKSLAYIEFFGEILRLKTLHRCPSQGPDCFVLTRSSIGPCNRNPNSPTRTLRAEFKVPWETWRSMRSVRFLMTSFSTDSC
jgi:hypothetical protein